MRRSGMGLGLVGLLIVALIIAFLVVQQVDHDTPQASEAEGYQDLVDQAQDAVDAINGHITIPGEE